MDTETTTVRHRGRPVGERAVPRIDVQLTPELRREIRMAAAAADISLGEWLKQAAREKLDRDAG